jgi:TRAP-type C4-dicarboxylate transport system permease small subunit
MLAEDAKSASSASTLSHSYQEDFREMGTQAALTPVIQTPGAFKRIDKYITLVSKWFYWIAGGGTIAMLALVIADIVGIKALAHPVPGGIEIVAFLGAIVIGFAIAYVQVLHGHIQVDIIVMKLPARPRAVIEACTAFLGIVLFMILSWWSWEYARSIQLSGQVSMTQRIPLHPFIYAMAFCYLITFLVLVMEFIKAVMKAGQRWTP